MSLIHGDSLSSYARKEDLTRNYSEYGTDIAISATGGRTGGPCLYTANVSAGFTKSLSTKYATLVVGMAIKPLAFHSTDNNVLALCESSTMHVRFRINSSGYLTAYRGDGTLIGTGSTPLSVNADAYLEFKVALHDTAGSIAVKVNGSADSGLALSGIDTRNGDSGVGFNVVKFIRQMGVNDSSQSCYIRDIYICDTSGSTCNDFLGDVRFDRLIPSGAGATNTFDEIASQTFRDAAHKYWRLVCHASTASDGLNIYEMEMRATVGGADQCSGGTASDSYHYSTSDASKAFNNSNSDAWQVETPASHPDVYIQYAFASPVVVKELAILRVNAGLPSWFTFYASDDDVTYTPVLSVANAQYTVALNSFQAFAIEAATPHSNEVDSTYTPAIGLLSSMTNGAKELFALSDPSTAISGNVKAVVVHNAVKKTGGGVARCHGVVRSGTVESVGSTFYASTSISDCVSIHETNPATGAAWTPTEVNAMQAGLECVA